MFKALRWPVLAVLALTFPLSLYAQSSARPLPQSLLAAFNKAKIQTDDVAIYAMPIEPVLNDRTPAWGLNANMLVNPASVVKVLTTGIALDMLGSTYQFRTGFHADAEPVDGVLRGSLYIKGGGDPGFLTSDLWGALRSLRAKGVKTIAGNVVLDDSVFSDVGVALSGDDAAAFDESPHRAYHAQPYGLLMNHGAMSIDLELDRDSVRVVPEEAPASWAFVSEVRLVGGACGSWKNGMQVGFTRRGDNVVVTVAGNYPRACGTSRLPIRIPPQDWLWESWFREIWAQLGGELRGQVVKGKTPNSTLALTTVMGRPMADHIRQVNKWSSNVMARHLELAVAGTPQAFGPKVLGWLATQGVPTTGWVIDNGSGLSRKTLVDPKGLAQFLRNMAQRPDFPDYLASFPRAGADGTVRKRMNEVDGYAYLKTGSLSGTRSVAGYVRAQDRQWWAVAIMVRSPNAAESWPAMEGVIEFIYRSR